MSMISDVELWDGQKRLAEELRGDVTGADMYLGPRGKVPDSLTNSQFYTAATSTTRWTVEFLHYDDGGVKLRVRDTNKILT